MLTITKPQMAALEDVLRQRFIDRLRRELEYGYPELVREYEPPTLQILLEGLVGKAGEFGHLTEVDIFAFIRSELEWEKASEDGRDKEEE